MYNILNFLSFQLCPTQRKVPAGGPTADGAVSAL